MKKIKLVNSMRDVKFTDLKNFRDLIELSEGQPNQEEYLSYSILKIFYDISREDARKLDPKDFEEAINAVANALTEEIVLQNIVCMKGVTYGLIPNFSKITAGELIDMDALLADKDIIQLMSILYRPIIGEVNSKGEYRIVDYEEYDYRFENIDAFTVEGALAFFTKSLGHLKTISK